MTHTQTRSSVVRHLLFYKTNRTWLLCLWAVIETWMTHSNWTKCVKNAFTFLEQSQHRDTQAIFVFVKYRILYVKTRYDTNLFGRFNCPLFFCSCVSFLGVVTGERHTKKIQNDHGLTIFFELKKNMLMFNKVYRFITHIC